MKYLPLLLLIFASSLCINLPVDLGPINDIFSGDVVVQGDPYLQLNAQIIPAEAVSGRNLLLIFDLTNNNNYDIRNVNVIAYDQCIFSGNNSFYRVDMKPNQTVTWRWEWRTGQTRLEKDCEIKISAQYDALYTLYQDIVVMTEDEYLSRQTKGTLYNVPIQSKDSDAPLDITLTFPEKQPFLSGTDGYSMYLEYYSAGDGFLKVPSSTINIGGSDNIGTPSCVGGSVSKDGTLNFVNKKSSRRTCNFNTRSITQPLSISTMTITANYTYIVDKIVPVRVKPGEPEDLYFCSDIGGSCVSESQCTGPTRNYQYTSDCSVGEVCCL